MINFPTLVKSLRLSLKDIIMISFALSPIFLLLDNILSKLVDSSHLWEGFDWFLCVFAATSIMGLVTEIIIPFSGRFRSNYYNLLSYLPKIPNDNHHINICILTQKLHVFRWSFLLLTQLLIIPLAFAAEKFDFFTSAHGIVVFMFFSALFYIICINMVKWGKSIFTSIVVCHALLFLAYIDHEEAAIIALLFLVNATIFFFAGSFYQKMGKELIAPNNPSFFEIEKRFKANLKRRTITAWFAEKFLTAHSPLKSIKYLLYAIVSFFIVFSIAAIFFNYLILFLWGFCFTFLGIAYQHLKTDALKMLKYDTRKPTLLLRSFKDDGLHTEMDYGSLEDIIISVTKKLSPTVCIGNPKDDYPTSGAYRAYIGNSDEKTWKQLINHWMENSQIIVVIAGYTEYVNWELAQLHHQGYLYKTVIVIPPEFVMERNERWQVFKDQLEIIYPTVEISQDSYKTLVAIIHDSNGKPSFIHSLSHNKTDYVQALKIFIGLSLDNKKLFSATV